MKRIACAILALTLVNTEAIAGEILSNYNIWSSLSNDAKAGVMIGMADEIVSFAMDDSSTRKAVAAGVEQCLFNASIKAGALANAVESWYRADAKRKSMPVSIAFFSAVTHGICKDYVDIQIKKPTM